MNRDIDTQKLLDFVDGALSPRETEELLDRLQQDPALRREVESLRSLARCLEEMPEERPGAGFTQRFMATHAAPTFFERVSRFFAELPAPVVPSMALAGGLAVALMMLGGGGPGGEARPAAGCTLIASAGLASVNGQDRGGEIPLHLEDVIAVDDTFQGEIRYPDGTHIEVRPGTELQVRNRGIRLHQGGVWLEVTKDLQGFQVETPLALAAVKGTAFSVFFEKGLLEVFVKEGLVEVSSEKNRKLLAAGKGAKVGENRVVEALLGSGRHTMFGDQEQGGFDLDGEAR